MKVLVIGSTGGSGRAAVQQLLARGHEVTAFTRAAAGAFPSHPGLRIVQGDALDEASVLAAVAGQDAVVVTLGIRENPLRVRLWGSQGTPIDVRSAGTRNVISAMRRTGVRKLVVQTTYGVGATRERLRWIDSLFLSLLLKPQIADTELQHDEVMQSGLDWVLAQPVHLTDDDVADEPFLSTTGGTARMKVSRNSVGRFLAEAAESLSFVGQQVALSGRA